MAEKKTARRGYLRDLPSRFEEGAEDVMKAWRTGAKRPDRIGDVSYHSLELLHRVVRIGVRALSRLEKETQPPTRTAKPAGHVPAAHAHSTQAPAEPASGGPSHATPRHAVTAKKHSPEVSAS